MKNKTNFDYYFSIVGSLPKQSMILEKIFSDLGAFDTSYINPKNHSSFVNFISFCVDERRHNALSEFEIDELLEKVTEQAKVSANWSIIPPKNLCKDLSIRSFTFRNKEDMMKYFVYHSLGENYNILH